MATKGPQVTLTVRPRRGTGPGEMHAAGAGGADARARRRLEVDPAMLARGEGLAPASTECRTTSPRTGQRHGCGAGRWMEARARTAMRRSTVLGLSRRAPRRPAALDRCADVGLCAETATNSRPIRTAAIGECELPRHQSADSLSPRRRAQSRPGARGRACWRSTPVSRRPPPRRAAASRPPRRAARTRVERAAPASGSPPRPAPTTSTTSPARGSSAYRSASSPPCRARPPRAAWSARGRRRPAARGRARPAPPATPRAAAATRRRRASPARANSAASSPFLRGRKPAKRHAVGGQRARRPAP